MFHLCDILCYNVAESVPTSSRRRQIDVDRRSTCLISFELSGIQSLVSFHTMTGLRFYSLEKYISFFEILSLSSATQASKLSSIANVSGSFVNNDKGK